MKTNELLEKLSDELTIIIDEVNALKALSDEQLNWKENAERWSVLECIEHLNRYNNFYLTAIEQAFDSAGKFIDEDVRSTWIGSKSISMMHPSNLKKQRTFKKMNPVNSEINREAINDFLRDQEKLEKLFTRAASININTKKVPVEFFRLLKMNIGEALEFVIVHEQRHVLQTHTIKLKITETKRPVLAV